MNRSELKNKLTEEEYSVAVEGYTERPFSGELLDEKRLGTFSCKVCGVVLFESGSKFDSSTGWPSFDKALPGAVTLREDASFGMHRNEATCTNCGAHLGHVFADGPTESGERYCINSVCLSFDEKKSSESDKIL